jgi:hypothetical protein
MSLRDLHALSVYKIDYSHVDEKPGVLGNSLKRVVDVRGFEPLTPCLQSRCSAS